MTSLSLIIITREAGPRLARCLAASASQEPGADEIVVVFDAPAPAGLPELGRSGSALRHRVVRGRGLGRAAARNDGAGVADGDLLLFLDGDIIAAPGLVAAYRDRAAESRGLIRGRVRELLGAAVCADLAVGGAGFPAMRVSDLEAKGFSPSGYRTASNQLEQAVEARFIHGEIAIPSWIASSGANFGISRRDWDRLGAQDERFGTRWGCEDLEFSYRAVAAFGDVTFLPSAIGYHLSHQQPDRWADHQRSLELFVGLHPDPAIQALEHLLVSDGTLGRYRAALPPAPHPA